MAERLSFLIHGQMASKSNSRKFATIKGRTLSIKSPQAQAFVRGALAQIPPQCRRRFEGPIRVRVVAYYASNRSDLDEQLVLDCLQDQWARVGGDRVLVQAGVYRNDRQIVARSSYKRIDALRPRVEVTVWALQDQ